ncbi:uncharacterized protein I303_100463 [Kwoniella dejecticola CBS 10117]|uniref:Signal recognition particle subunit SRP68 n=1 Tax=Kwoniella dejecticola CBS 10117 TaxID=1296121 RepID=A0A1A6AF09_9TREE|nr:uncharacterized protein I303_00463 [Kwoniella dejecticola CBS 10117]OBR88646.1 hypothetical protein I303_00463 [Kwoniella dejecticola CBS 10117]
MAQADLSFPLLSQLSKERAVYGLRNGDHERYRRHCTNKIHRLRTTTGQTCGKGKQYKAPPKLEVENVKDVRHLQLLLFSAERALAHSHEFKAQKAKPNPSSSPYHLKKDQISWLRRSLKLSTNLFDLVNALTQQDQVAGVKLNTRTKVEVTIYHLLIRSELYFEKANYGNCLYDLVAVRKLLTILNGNSKNSYDEALSNEFIDLDEPLIRYCAYKLGRSESHDIQGIVNDIEDKTLEEESLPGYISLADQLKEELSGQMEVDKAKLQPIVFAEQPIELRNPELVNVMIKVQETLGRFESKKSNNKNRSKNVSMKGWDKVLSVLGEAEGVARRLKDDHEASGSSTSLRSTQITTSLNLAHAYIVHSLLSHRIQRDLSLIDTLSSNFSNYLPASVGDTKIKGGKTRVEEVVKGLGGIIKLLDTVLQSLRGISELSIVQEKEGVRVGVEGLENYYHALKCFTLARLHCLHPTPSYSSAVSLFQKATTSINQARSSLIEPITTIEEEIVHISSEQIDALENDINVLDVGAKKGLFSQNIEKPVFFDMAFNYIDIPFDELEVLSGKKEKSTQTTTGIVAENLASVSNKTVEGIKKLGRETRETTPAVELRPTAPHTTARNAKQPAKEDDDEDEVGTEDEGRRQGQGGPQEGKKGWLGGWFGRGK